MARQTLRLCEHFVTGTPPRTAAELVDVNGNTAIPIARVQMLDTLIQQATRSSLLSDELTWKCPWNRGRTRAAVNLNLSLITVRQNEVVRRLAGWAALLAAPTLLASWYRMNFHDMPELDNPYAYPAIIAITVVACGTLFIVLKRAGRL